MANSKSHMFIFFLVMIIFTKDMTTAQLNLVNIVGVLPCSLRSSGIGNINVPPFPNATVEVTCGGSEQKVLANTTTDDKGAFSILLGPGPRIIPDPASVIKGCRLISRTPLSSCNSSLPSTGLLTSSLTKLSDQAAGGIIMNLMTFIPTQFLFVP